MKIDRLIAITNYLLCHGRTSAQKLAVEFEVSSRTIIRDMDTLGQAGIPVQSTCGVDGGYEIIKDYVVDKQLIDHEDFDYIVTALQGLMSAYVDCKVKQTMDKILPLYKKKDIVRLDFGIANEKNDVNKKINALENAIRQQTLVQFQYTNNDNKEKTIKVEPVRLEFKWYNWYLIAFYPKYQDYCMFKLVRMEDLETLQEKNTLNHSEKEIVIHDERETITVILRGKSEIKSKCTEYLNGEVTKVFENGDFEFSFTVPENEIYWYGVILSFGKDVTVLKPESVIKKITETCDEVKKNYM